MLVRIAAIIVAIYANAAKRSRQLRFLGSGMANAYFLVFLTPQAGQNR